MRLHEWYTLHSQIVSKIVLFNLFCQNPMQKDRTYQLFRNITKFFPTYLCTKPNSCKFPLNLFPSYQTWLK